MTIQTQTLIQRIARVQNELAPIVKDKNNPHFRNSYFDVNDLIAAVKPLALKNGLVWLQPLAIMDGRNVLKNVIVDAATGEKIEYDTLLPDIADPQKLVAAVTYFKRITGSALWLVEGEQEDDGNTAAATKKAVDPTNAIDKLQEADSLETLKSIWATLSAPEKNHVDVQRVKDEMKAAIELANGPTVQVD